MSQKKISEEKMSEEKISEENLSLLHGAFKKFVHSKISLISLIIIMFFVGVAVFAPFIANNLPLLYIAEDGSVYYPFLKAFFRPTSSEILIEQVYNYLALFFVSSLIIWGVLRIIKLHKNKWLKWSLIGISSLLLAIPFFTMKTSFKTHDWQKLNTDKNTIVFAPIPYAPSELISAPYQKPSRKHYFGSDKIGRDVLSRMIYGTRVSIAVGLFATAIAIFIGTIVGIFAGYYGGFIDMAVMRVVEVIICFPTFLLLLILMVMFLDKGFNQSILIVIGVIGLSSWTGLSRLVRGETLKVRNMAYIQSCEASGLHPMRIMTFHILPNVTAPILIAFTFGVAGAILAESGLSFLGFGVQPPTASWGELLKQASADPFNYWHLTLFPGVTLFIIVCTFNFIGEGLRKVLNPRG